METNQIAKYNDIPIDLAETTLTFDFGDGNDLIAITEFRINKGKLPEVIKTYTKDNIDYLKK